MPTGRRGPFILRMAPEGDVPLLLDFHKRNLTEYLWPRTAADFERLAWDRCLYEVVQGKGAAPKIVAICYLMHGSEPDSSKAERDEFGGVYVIQDCRGIGLAAALGRAAISNHHVWDPPKRRLVAHVHEANQSPRNLLQDQLGFIPAGHETMPGESAPPTMARNSRGEVVGDLFEFQKPTLRDFADWIEGFTGIIQGKAGRARLSMELDSMASYRKQTLIALRELAGPRSEGKRGGPGPRLH